MSLLSALAESRGYEACDDVRGKGREFYNGESRSLKAKRLTIVYEVQRNS